MPPCGSHGGGLLGTSVALEVHDDGSGPALYVGGEIVSAGGVPVSDLARWNGTSWSDVGGGTDGDVLDLRSVNLPGLPNALVVAGKFSNAGGVFVDGIAAWNGSGFAPIGALRHPWMQLLGPLAYRFSPGTRELIAVHCRSREPLPERAA